jgi:EAL domain-containing protein (putative c-di-GMP-specific phosphodiesterase class I)
MVVASTELSGGELQTLGERMLAGFAPLRVHALSLHNDDGDVLWLNESVIGPDEHAAVREAVDVFAGHAAPPRIDHPLGDDRTAILLRAADPRGAFVGVVMLIVDARSLAAGRGAGAGQLPDNVMNAVHDFAARLASRAAAAQTATNLALPALDEPPGAAPRAAAPQVDAAIDRHYAALRSLPIALYVQRLVPLRAASRVRRYEVLLRSGSQTDPQAAPRAMLTTAVKHGLGSVIDARVATGIITWLARHPQIWQERLVRFSVNLSANALFDDPFVKLIELCLAKSALPKALLAFEIGEQLCREHRARVAALGNAFSRLGVALIIDDFSLHEGSMDLLRIKGLRTLKIDPALTSNVRGDKVRQATVAAIAQAARVMGMRTVAKRVESEEDREWLAALGIDFVQGFIFGAPEPIDALLTASA